MGLDLAKELDQMAAKHGFAKPHRGMIAAKLPRHRPSGAMSEITKAFSAVKISDDDSKGSSVGSQFDASADPSHAASPGGDAGTGRSCSFQRVC